MHLAVKNNWVGVLELPQPYYTYTTLVFVLYFNHLYISPLLLLIYVMHYLVFYVLYVPHFKCSISPIFHVFYIPCLKNLDNFSDTLIVLTSSCELVITRAKIEDTWRNNIYIERIAHHVFFLIRSDISFNLFINEIFVWPFDRRNFRQAD